VVAADYPFFDLILSMAIFFLWIVWIWILIEVIADIFRRHDVSGWAKTAWLVFVILLPFLGVFVYLITQNVGMTERKLARARARQDQFDAYVRERADAVGAGSAGEIEKAKQLLDSGAITQAEYEALKQKALAT
jgi:ABC-type transport system involved in cytochrome bd biosynthesis fused ATPase/permease subunit